MHQGWTLPSKKEACSEEGYCALTAIGCIFCWPHLSLPPGTPPSRHHHSYQLVLPKNVRGFLFVCLFFSIFILSSVTDTLGTNRDSLLKNSISYPKMNFKWKRTKGINFSFSILYVLKFLLCQHDMTSFHEDLPGFFREGKGKSLFSLEHFS